MMCNAKATIYRFLSFLYHDEIPLAFIEEMRTLPFLDRLREAATEFSSVGFRSGLNNMLTALQKSSAQEIYNELRYEYAELFLNAGKNPVFPYASCHVSGEPLVMQKPVFEVRQVYRDSGVHKNPADPDLDDHIAVELEFMAYLAEQQGAEEEQRAFLVQHLGWADAFCEMFRSAARTEFYQGLADLTQACLRPHGQRQKWMQQTSTCLPDPLPCLSLASSLPPCPMGQFIRKRVAP